MRIEIEFISFIYFIKKKFINRIVYGGLDSVSYFVLHVPTSGKN